MKTKKYTTTRPTTRRRRPTPAPQPPAPDRFPTGHQPGHDLLFLSYYPGMQPLRDHGTAA